MHRFFDVRTLNADNYTNRSIVSDYCLTSHLLQRCYFFTGYGMIYTLQHFTIVIL
jgi:hypothetical protein